jgi:hypothetical protein
MAPNNSVEKRTLFMETPWRRTDGGVDLPGKYKSLTFR